MFIFSSGIHLCEAEITLSTRLHTVMQGNPGVTHIFGVTLPITQSLYGVKGIILQDKLREHAALSHQ